MLTIKASGTVKETIEAGAYVNIDVKYGYIKLIHQTLDLCENAGEVGLKCPIEKGDIVLTKEVELPKAIPLVSPLSILPARTDRTNTGFVSRENTMLRRRCSQSTKILSLAFMRTSFSGLRA